MSFRNLVSKSVFVFSNESDTEVIDDLIDRFIEKAVENNGLQFGGGGDENEWDGFVTLDKPRGSAANSHREAVEQWFIQEPEVLEYYVTSLMDAWYGDFDNIKIEWIKKEKV